MKEAKPDWIFECYKCGHNLYIDKKDIRKMLKTDCPECGEEPDRNWFFIGEGNFDKR